MATIPRATKTNSVVLSPRANYTDWANATCRPNLGPTFADREVSRGQRGGSPTVSNLSFLDRSRYFTESDSNNNNSIQFFIIIITIIIMMMMMEPG
jgi:hypothetical protein